MSTLTFPSIEPPVYPLEEQYEDNSISSAMEDGTVTGRRKFTKSRTTWTLKWTALPDSDHTLLMDFIRKTVYFKSLSFAWTNPQTETTHEVRVASVDTWSQNVSDTWSGGLTITEV